MVGWTIYPIFHGTYFYSCKSQGALVELKKKKKEQPQQQSYMLLPIVCSRQKYPKDSNKKLVPAYPPAKTGSKQAMITFLTELLHMTVFHKS